MDAKALIAAKLAEWDLELTDAELDKLVIPYENLLRWQRIVEDMRQSRQLVEGMSIRRASLCWYTRSIRKGERHDGCPRTRLYVD